MFLFENEETMKVIIGKVDVTNRENKNICPSIKTLWNKEIVENIN